MRTLSEISLACLVLVSGPLFAQAAATLTWEHPTEYTDGSPLPLADIANTGLFWSSSTCDPEELLGAAMVLVDAPATEHVIEDLGPGTWCFTARTGTTGGLVSDPSNVASKTITATPFPPENLTAAGGDAVYAILQAPDRVVLSQIGTLSSPTPCDDQVAVADSNGRVAFQVPQSAVTFFTGSSAEVVFALCGA
jgi:hypothetical protein